MQVMMAAAMHARPQLICLPAPAEVENERPAAENARKGR
jgi:hypothetical protein